MAVYTYDADADVLYVLLADEADAAIDRTEEVGPNLHVDLDVDGGVVGVEFLYPRSQGIDAGPVRARTGSTCGSSSASLPDRGSDSLPTMLSHDGFDPSSAAFRDDGASLDLLYIPTRYPNGLPGGLPSDAFRGEDAERSLARAGSIIEAVGKTFVE